MRECENVYIAVDQGKWKINTTDKKRKALYNADSPLILTSVPDILLEACARAWGWIVLRIGIYDRWIVLRIGSI